MRPNFFHHLHPPTIPAEQSRWRYTLGAGGMAVFLALVLMVTGVLEMFYFIPAPTEAALSIQKLTYFVPFGGMVRNLHFWAAQLLLFASAIHLIRVIFTGAYLPPRRINYLLGLALFVLIILLDFTGYILRWDQGIQWVLVVGANLVKSIPWLGDHLHHALVGGAQPNATTLIRFYAWHLFGLTLPAIILVFWHAFRVRRDGGIAAPSPSPSAREARISRFELVRREAAAMLFAGAALLLLSTFFPAPIAPAITAIAAPAGDHRVPWFFLWVQQMLQWGDPFLWGVAVPLLTLLTLTLIPFVFPPPTAQEQGRWFPKSNRLAQITLTGIVCLILLFTLFAVVSQN